MDDKEFIKVIDVDGTENTYELITKINSNKDNKVYYIMTSDQEINDEVNIVIGYTYSNEDVEETSEIIMVYDDEEFNYVESLINEQVGDNYDV